MVKDKIHITPDGMVVVNGQEYLLDKDELKEIDGIKHINKTTVRKFDRKGFDKKVDYVKKKIEKSLDKKRIVEELLKKHPVKEIDRLYNLLKEDESKVKKKKMSTQDGCYGLKIGSGKKKTGGMYLSLFD